MDDSVYLEHWRMDWGFGNPNKTAALIVIIMLAVWGLAYIQKWGFWAALSLFTGFGVCLVLTQSRGGLVALLVSGLFVAAWLPRPFPLGRLLAVLAGCLALIIFALAHKGESRYTEGFSGQDRSVKNRLLIWEQVPSMIHDASDGWGLGKSGDAYMQWYQPIPRGEGYRTLVNSHLTWLVELNWWGRIAYICCWAAVFVVLWPRLDHRWFAIPCAIWIAFAICASFSSTAEALPLWFIPAIALGVVLFSHSRQKTWPGLYPWLDGALISALILLSIFMWGRCSSSFSIHFLGNGVITLGNKRPEIWIIGPSTNILGEHYGHEIRRGFDAEPIFRQRGLGISSEITGIPKGETLVLSGQVPPSLNIFHPAQLVLIDPKPLSADKLTALLINPSVTVVIGEFSQNKGYWMQQSQEYPNIKVQLVEGSEEYIPKWMHEIAKAVGSNPSHNT